MAIWARNMIESYIKQIPFECTLNRPSFIFQNTFLRELFQKQVVKFFLDHPVLIVPQQSKDLSQQHGRI